MRAATDYVHMFMCCRIWRLRCFELLLDLAKAGGGHGRPTKQYPINFPPLASGGFLLVTYARDGRPCNASSGIGTGLARRARTHHKRIW